MQRFVSRVRARVAWSRSIVAAIEVGWTQRLVVCVMLLGCTHDGPRSEPAPAAPIEAMTDAGASNADPDASGEALAHVSSGTDGGPLSAEADASALAVLDAGLVSQSLLPCEDLTRFLTDNRPKAGKRFRTIAYLRMTSGSHTSEWSRSRTSWFAELDPVTPWHPVGGPVPYCDFKSALVHTWRRPPERTATAGKIRVELEAEVDEEAFDVKWEGFDCNPVGVLALRNVTVLRVLAPASTEHCTH
jgi:hypothetical protein